VPVLLLTLVLLGQPPGDLGPLENARRLAGELRYEEAVVDYQRYLALPDKPVAERARALVELGFIHFVLGDERTGQQRAFEALELDPSLRLSPEAPARQVRFFESMRQRFETRTRIEILPGQDASAPQRVRARVVDPLDQARSVLLRHALAAEGPFWGLAMRCEGELCTGEIPGAAGAEAFTAWYYVEANDAEGNTLARGAGPQAPLRISVVTREPWYRSPWVYAGGAAAVVGAAVIFYAASAPAR
jgi:hypothetical protein